MLKKVAKGFTLIELMIVVAIIGILAAIAIPNFIKYQLRSKFGELKINLEAVRSAQNSLQQGERPLCPNGALPPVTGKFVALTAPLPTAGIAGVVTPQATNKFNWTAADLATAGKLDWKVEGNTYGVYDVDSNDSGDNTCTGLYPGIGNFGLDYTAGATSNIDGEAVLSGVCLWAPQRNPTTGALVVAPMPCPAGGFAGADNVLCGGWAYIDGSGQTPQYTVHTCSDGDTF
jgi:type IV pilus assembly protein PilA